MRRTINRGYLFLPLLACLISFACDHSAQTSQQSAFPRHYQLKGKVVSIDKRSKAVNIDNEAIPGFMDAMTMPYQVKPESELDKLHPGDAITADLIVQDTSAWLQNITVTSHPASGQNNKN